MKKRIITLIVLCLAISTTYLQAQGEYFASPQNYAEVAEDVLSHYSAGIEIPAEKLLVHLKTVVKPSTYSEECKVPNFDNTSQEGENVFLNWPDLQDNSGYTVTYLNLATGKSQSFFTAEAGLVLHDLPDAMYMVSVINHCNPEGGDDGPTSGAHIIIMDKPVLLIDNPFVDCPCEKIALEFHVNTNSTPMNPIVMPWSPVAPFHYFLKIGYSGGAGSSVTLATFPNPNAPPEYRFKGQCMSFLNYGYSLNANTFFGPGPTGSLYSLYLSPSDYSWTLDDPGNLVQNIWMFRCHDKVSDDRSATTSEVDFAEDQLFPNPAISMITIRHQNRTDQETKLIIVNEMGQIMKEGIIPAYADQWDVDIAEWPAGIYRATLMNDQRAFSQSFVKISQQ